ncbi:hypothetical protein CQW23_04095 [Capsicum baccatum]|uniref:Reverse transcriptase Ty1/copia-type domain-containing protein n=1 Tax=Capsicum baccatum TaxID=33114 RepID=A0A2G2XDS8_CAPBA|nr:hypothetical protein CQW23_04095 [Capsicum baccatum]
MHDPKINRFTISRDVVFAETSSLFSNQKLLVLGDDQDNLALLFPEVNLSSPCSEEAESVSLNQNISEDSSPRALTTEQPLSYEEVKGCPHWERAMLCRESLRTFHHRGVKKKATPMKPNLKLKKDEGKALKDAIKFWQLVGSMIYLTITRSEISYCVGVISQFMHNLTTSHLSTAKRILRYVKGSLSMDFGTRGTITREPAASTSQPMDNNATNVILAYLDTMSRDLAMVNERLDRMVGERKEVVCPDTRQEEGHSSCEL